MQILSTKQTRRQGSVSRPEPQPRNEAERGGILDTFRPKYDKLNVHLDSPEYQNVKDLEAANMLGHFTQTMQNNGYPWKLLSAEAMSDGSFKKSDDISDLEALKRLKKGEPVLLQPMRDLQLDLSSGSITAIAAAGSVASTNMTGLSKVASYSKNAQVSAGSQGLSVKFGEPVVIENFSQLKLLHQMYDPNDKIKPTSETAKAAHQFSYFTQKTVSSAYPWRFYQKDDSNTFLRVAKHTTKGALTGAAVGGALAGAFGAIMALGFRDLTYLAGAAAIGAGIGGVSGGYDSARTSLKGTPVNAVEALEKVLHDEEVVFQESRARSINVPIMGKISWFSDQGKGSKVSNPDELNTFYYMQSQDELPKAEEPKKKEEKKPETPTITILDQSVHNHYQTNPTRVVVIDEHPIHSYQHQTRF
jgi:hypothetical protein